MNRVIARKVVPAYHQIFKLSRKQFCSDEAAKSSAAAASSQFNQESDGNLSPTGNVQPYDIAIVGGGMVGMALACSLATTPLTKHLRVAIIDSSPALSNKPCIKREDPPDPRVSTVTPATISFFKDTGAWQYVQQHRHAYFDKMQVWDYTSLGYTKYDARDVDKEVLGCVVENKVLHSSLLSRIEDTDFQKTIYHSRLTSMSLHPSSSSIVVDSTASTEASYARGRVAKLELSDGNSLYAKLVVGSDGGKSQVRELAGFKTTGWKYSQNAVICTVEHSVENYCAWQRFLPSGPIALLPIGDKFSNIVWTMNPEESSDFKSVKEDDFVKAVNHALDYGYGPHPKSSLPGSAGMFSWLRGNVTILANKSFEIPPKVVKLASERMAFPLSLMHANEYASKRVVLIGDAVTPLLSLFPMATFTLSSSLTTKTLTPTLAHLKPTLLTSFKPLSWACPQLISAPQIRYQPLITTAAVGSDYSARRSNSSNDDRETILLPGCDYNHWLIVMEFPKDPAPTREQMIDTYLNTLATVLGSMEEAKKNMYAFSTTTYTGFQCTVDEATSEKFKGLPGVLWVLPDSYIDVKNKDYGGDKYVNGEIIPCTYPTYQPKQRNTSKYESRRYERRRDGPPPDRRRPRQGTTKSESASP